MLNLQKNDTVVILGKEYEVIYVQESMDAGDMNNKKPYTDYFLHEKNSSHVEPTHSLKVYKKTQGMFLESHVDSKQTQKKITIKDIQKGE